MRMQLRGCSYKRQQQRHNHEEYKLLSDVRLEGRTSSSSVMKASTAVAPTLASAPALFRPCTGRPRLQVLQTAALPSAIGAPKGAYGRWRRLARVQAQATNAASTTAGTTGGGQEVEWDQEIDELMRLVALMPPSVRGALESHPGVLELLEVVLDLGRQPIARFPSGDEKLCQAPVSSEDIQFAVGQLGEFGGDNRAGLDRTLHRVSALRNRSGRIIGLTCRVGRAVKGSASMVRDLALSGASILLLGRPGVGKTTAIREVSRLLADEASKRVVIVDTSNEIGGDGDIPHGGIGRARRMQVPRPEAQHTVMIEAVENHMPQVIVIDEIGTSEECAAARTIAQRGVQLVATAHGNQLENVIKNPQLADLVGGIQSVTLGDDEARRRGVQKSILERAAPPTFDVCIEMLERTKWRVHLDVGQAVDLVLAGGDAGGQVRERAADGSVLKYNYNPAISGVIRGAPHRGSGAGGAAAGGAGSSSGGGGGGGGNAELAAATAGTSREGGGNGFAIRSPVASLSGSLDADREEGGGSGDEEGGGDFGVGKRFRRVISRQAVAGVTAEDAVLRLFPYELDEDVLWEVMGEMRLQGKVFVTTSLAGADAVLALRARVKHNAELRARAREAGVPIYAVKSAGSSNLLKAFRTLLGIDPSAGGVFGPPGDSAAADSPRRATSPPSSPAASSSPTSSAAASSDEDEPHLGSSSRASSSSSPSSSLSSSSRSAAASAAPQRVGGWSERQAVAEAQEAVAEVVRPLGQPVELAPRAERVREAQIRLLESYGLPYEVVGSGDEARLRILPLSAGSAAAATAAAAEAKEVEAGSAATIRPEVVDTAAAVNAKSAS